MAVQRGRVDIVSRLNELVEAASRAIRQQSTNGSHQIQTVNNASETCTTEDALRRLYPSIGQGQRPSNTCRSNRNWPLTGSNRNRKASKEKETVAYKDVFVMNNPKTYNVPRRQERQYFYDSRLVASAVAFKSSMRESDKRNTISTSIPLLQQLELKPEFEFVKAVGPRLVSVPEITEWNYRILKHQTGQGPLYVRSFSYVDVPMSSGLKSKEGEAMNVIEDDDDWSLKAVFEDMNETPTPAHLSHDNASNGVYIAGCSGLLDPAGDAREPEKVEVPKSGSKEQCPMCSCWFPSDSVQLHITACIDTTLNPEEKLYNELMFQDGIDVAEILDSDEEAQCLVAEPLEKEDQMLSPCEIRQRLGEITKRLSSNVAPNTRRFYVRRKNMWKDYIDFRKKPWIKKESQITIVFVGEPAVDDGGPKREFFAGKFLFL